ncbi:MAG: hypothetical protein U0X86_000824 [Wolbachia endosymbiont of Xenopsylla cheopis]
MGKSPRKESFRYLIEALSQKRLSELLELEIDGYGGIFHLIAMYGGDPDILSILIERIPQRTLFELVQERKGNCYMPFQIAALFNLEMILPLIKKMSPDQLYTLLTIKPSDYPMFSIPLKSIILQYKNRTEISRNVVNALIEELSDSQFFSLISTQLKFTKVCNGGTDNLVLTVKIIPETSRLSNDLQLCTNEFKKQMLKQLYTHLQQGEDYSFPHNELYDDSSLLRIFLVQMKGEELYQMKDYNGFIYSKSLLPTILNYNKLEFDSSYAISESKCLELIRREKDYGYSLYQVESSDHFTMLVSTKKLPKEVCNEAHQLIRGTEFLSSSAIAKKAVAPFKTNSIIGIKQKLDITAFLNFITHTDLTFAENLDILRSLRLEVANNTYRIDLHSLVNLFMPLISNKGVYREQIYVDGNWEGYRTLANIEEVSTNEIVEKGKKIYIDGKELIKYKNRMYEYQVIPCSGAEKIELLLDMGLFIPYIELLPNLYLQSIDLSNQEYCKQQKVLAKQFIESGNGFFISRKNLISTLSKVFKVVFPRNGLDKMTIGLLLFYNRSLPYIETAFGLSTKLRFVDEEYCLSLNRKAEDIMASLDKFNDLYKKIEGFAIDLCGKEIATKLKENNDVLGFLHALSERINNLIESSPLNCLQYLEHILSIDRTLHEVEKIEDKIECYQGLLNNLLLSVDINKKTVQRFIDEGFQVSHFKMIMRLYCHLESNNEVKAETIKNLKQYSGDFFSTQDDFQNSCHEIIHQILDQIHKQPKRRQFVNSELTGPSTSALSQEASERTR